MAIVSPSDGDKGEEQRDAAPPSPTVISISISTGEAFIETEDGERVVLWVE
jgi:hypothetical protein